MKADIGCGSHPEPDCDIYVDLYPDTARERMASSKSVVVPRGTAFVVADIHHLPFIDKSLDYVYAKEILEHCENPLLACSELSRVAKAGLVTVPAAFSEIFFGWRYHKWLILERAKTLFFFRKREEEHMPFGGYFRRQIGKKPGHVATPEIMRVKAERPGCFHIRLPWIGTLRAVVVDDERGVHK